MPIGTLVTDDYLKRFIEVTNHLSAEYSERLEPWADSPFAWILVKGGVKVDQCGGAKGSHFGPEKGVGIAGARASGA
jgi:hypothetical protein